MLDRLRCPGVEGAPLDCSSCAAARSEGHALDGLLRARQWECQDGQY